MSLRLDRRQLLASAAGLLGIGIPGLARADARQRRFLFVFANGGWDLSWGLHPFFDNPVVDSPTDGSEPIEVGNFSIVDGPERPAFRTFFERWSDHVGLLHGFEVRSVAHLNCRRLVFTGSAAAYGDDWPTLIASTGVGSETALPHLIVSGPGFAASYPDLVARVGRTGQLGALLDLSMLQRRDSPLRPLTAGSRDAVAAYLAERDQLLTRAASSTGSRDFYQRLADNRAEIPALTEAFAATSIGAATTFDEQLTLACEVLQNNISRCALVKHNGYNNMTWDTHGGIEGQADHYQDLFNGLLHLMQELTSRPGPSGGTLLDDTCVVVLSEMSRHPQINNTGGKDHWTWTSAMLIGSGVKGGQVVGGYDENLFGLPIDPATGEYSPSGTVLQAKHLGATVLALAGNDPAPYFDTETPAVTALIET